MNGYSNIPARRNQRSSSLASMMLPKLPTPQETMQGGMGGMNFMSLLQPLTGGQMHTQRMSQHTNLLNFLRKYDPTQSKSLDRARRFHSDYLKSGDLWKY